MLTDIDHERRKKGIGGSDIAAIAGLSKFKSPMDVYIEKTGGNPNRTMSAFQQRGHELEPIILSKYSGFTGDEIEKTNVSIQDREKDYLIGTLDAVTKKGIIVDAKCVSNFTRLEWGEPMTDQVPQHILLQMAHYARIHECEYVDVAALFVDTWDFSVYRYKRDKNLEDGILKLATNFWENNVLKMIPPEPRTKQEVAILFKNCQNELYSVADDLDLESYATLKDLNKQIKELEGKKESCESILMRSIGSNCGLKDKAGAIIATWKEQSSSRIDAKKIIEENPSMKEKYTTKSTFRVFRVK